MWLFNDRLHVHLFNSISYYTANEGRVEAISEAGERLLEERTPEAANVKARVADTRNQWEDLRELAHARQDVKYSS